MNVILEFLGNILAGIVIPVQGVLIAFFQFVTGLINPFH